MKIALLGGGMTGLTAGYYLSKRKNAVTIFEKEEKLGGMASGFKESDWSWYLDRSYHHLFANDKDILNFAEEINFNEIFFLSPQTASLYQTINPTPQVGGLEYSIIPIDNPIDFLKYPYLNIIQKLRAGAVLAFLKASPFMKFYERQSSKEFLKKTMGNTVWKILWQELFRKKFNKYAGNIVSTFIWARIKKRTKDLGYIKGGFQTLVDFLARQNKNQGAEIRKQTEITGLRKRDNSIEIEYKDGRKRKHRQSFDLVISTLPTPTLIKVGKNFFAKSYIKRLKAIKYLHAAVLVVQSETPILDKTYWLNVCVPQFPFTVIVQHTNLVDKSHYGGKHLAYIGEYVDSDDKRLKMEKEELLQIYQPYLRRLNPELTISNSYLFKTYFTQPVLDKTFLANKPDFHTPIKNFYVANLDMTYPYERGTNYAVKLGKEVSLVVEKI